MGGWAGTFKQAPAPPSWFGGPGGLFHKRPPVREVRMILYAKWLEETQGKIQEIVRLLENEEYHHDAGSNSDRSETWRLVLEIEASITERLTFYHDHKASH